MQVFLLRGAYALADPIPNQDYAGLDWETPEDRQVPTQFPRETSKRFSRRDPPRHCGSTKLVATSPAFRTCCVGRLA